MNLIPFLLAHPPTPFRAWEKPKKENFTPKVGNLAKCDKCGDHYDRGDFLISSSGRRLRTCSLCRDARANAKKRKNGVC